MPQPSVLLTTKVTDIILSSIFTNLKSKIDKIRNNALTKLKHHVEKTARERSGESLQNFIEQLNIAIQELVNSNNAQDRITAIRTIDTLIDVNYEDPRKITRFSNYLRNTLTTQHGDQQTVILVTRTLGRLAKASASTTSKTLTAEWVEFESRRALEWLEGDRHKDDGRRYAAVLVLKELAENAPTLFYTHVGNFFVHIWNGINDSNLEVREGSVIALRAVLALVSKRSSSGRVEWYHGILARVKKGFSSKQSELIHGSLLVTGELLKNTGNFMNSQFDELCETVLKFADNKDKLIKRAVIVLIPELAKFSNWKFEKYLDKAVTIILNYIKSYVETRSLGFLALGEISFQMKHVICKYKDTIVSAVKDGITPKRGKPFVEEAITCLSMLGKAVGPSIYENVVQLMDLMFSQGLSVSLTNALTSLVEDIPKLLVPIQDRILDIISMILARSPFNTKYVKSSIQLSIDYNNPQTISLALRTLGTFNMSGQNLTDFVKDCVVKYLDDDNATIRKEAAKTCCKLLVTEKTPPMNGNINVISEVLEKLLLVGLTDPDNSLRYSVLSSLDERFDQYLALADNLRTLFLALNDEQFSIRKMVVTIIGRLSTKNPAYALPELRKTLLQLLTELEFSQDTRIKEESARMLAHLITAAPRLIKPYVPAIVKVLVHRISDPNPSVSASVLHATGKLALVGGPDMMQFMDQLLPLVIENLQDQSSSSKREVTVRTLGKLIECTGYVVTPYKKYPKLLQLLLNILKTEESWTTRKAVMKVLGIIGAIDPYKHKSIIKANIPDDDHSVSALDPPELLPGIGPSNEEYFPTVAIHSLMRILKDPSLNAHHTAVIQAVMFIFTSLGTKCVNFLPQIMPPFLNLIKTCESSIRTSLFQQLGILVSIVKRSIKSYVKDIFKIMQEYWPADYKVTIISLTEELSMALNEEFKPYLADIIPQMLAILREDDKESSAKYEESLSTKVLTALVIFGKNLEDYLYQVIPAVMRFIEDTQTSVDLRITAVKTIGKLSRTLNFTEFASRIVLPLCRVLANTHQQLRMAVVDTLCALVHQLKYDYAIFIPIVSKTLSRHHIQHPKYEEMIRSLLKNVELPPLIFDDEEVETVQEDSIGDVKKMHVNQAKLKKAWEATQRSTSEDWQEWIRGFSVELLRESPSPALRACHALAQVYHPLARELFNAGFVSCWTELDDKAQTEVVRAIELAFSSPNLPPDVLQTLLNLAEFMEHDDKPLPIAISALGTLAEKCQCYAKALHHKEIEFQENPSSKIEELISINNQLQQYEAAMGILIYAQKHHSIKLKESWYEKLNRWEEALIAYENKERDAPHIRVTLGKMRCLKALGEWNKLYDLCTQVWQSVTEKPIIEQIAPLGAAAGWYLKRWDFMHECVSRMEEESLEGTFYRAILAIHQNQFEEAKILIDKTRQLLDVELTALVGESYNRAYETIVKVQQLSELEEIIMYKQQSNIHKHIDLKKVWYERLQGCQRHVDYWQNILQVRSLVLSPAEQLDIWLQFAHMCRKANKMKLSEKTLRNLIIPDAPDDKQIDIHTLISADSKVHPQVAYAYIEHMWAEGNREKAFQALKTFVQSKRTTDNQLLAQCHLILGKWQHALIDYKMDMDQMTEIISNLKTATEYSKDWHKAWHAWALMNNDIVNHYETNKIDGNVTSYLVNAVNGYFKSISLSPAESGKSLQDILRLLTLWFKYGAEKDVESALIQGFNTVKVDTWLQVIPQLIARVHTTNPTIRTLIHKLLKKIGKAHPQALIYSLTVSSKSHSPSRKAAAESLLNKLREHYPRLVDQAIMVSNELIRETILWHEMWHEGLEEASRLYFGDRNITGMFQVLAPLHKMLHKAETLSEISFQQAYGRDLQEALEWCIKYKQSKNEIDLAQAWDLYYYVFRKIHKQLSQMITLDLQYVSPKLLESTDLELAVPGTYRAGHPIVRIASFAPQIRVIVSKQRPRKINIYGSDGKEYSFLLKGHEDLRQDERVMQLFGLVNTLLSNDSETAKHDLAITRYAVIPLSSNAGLIGWVPNTDTFHSLIKEYRESRSVLINLEHRLMVQMAPNYDNLTLIQKIEVFDYALSNTTGQDLYKVLWLKSKNSEAWLDRRTNYTRSLAVMSMVGYILGLGDRHPLNLMLEKYTGKVVHIDFGDCFEVAMHRDKFPEKIPFRLTRMFVNAMEVSGIEGNFRSTCENVMRVLRENKHSVMAMLEAFVHDPLINWRLVDPKTVQNASQQKDSFSSDTIDFELRSRSVREKELKKITQTEQGSPPSEVLNTRALSVMARINAKLTGRDFSDTEELDVPNQVERLIEQATSHANLCQCYIGWCPFW